jgi:hypothetical protein
MSKVCFVSFVKMFELTVLNKLSQSITKLAEYI